MERTPQSLHIPSVLQLLICGLGAFGFWGLSLILLFFQFANGETADLTMFMLAIEAGIFGWLIFPGAASALRRLAGSPVPTRPVDWTAARLVIFAFPLVVAAGVGVANFPAISWLFLPVLYVLGILLPLVWFTATGARRLKALSRQRALGVFGASLSWTPLIILVAELILGGVALVLMSSVLANEPGFQTGLENLVQSLQAGPPDMPAIEAFALQYLAKPWIVAVGVIFIAGLIPLLEEALKPLVVWALVGRGLTPAGGFIAGMLSGAAFALFESLALLTSANDFGIVISTRLGTSLIHVVTAGLTGWGIALAWNKRSAGPLLGRYLLAVSIHAAWNGMTAMAVVSALPEIRSFVGNFPWEMLSGIGLPVLGVTGFVLLLVINQRLYVQTAAQQAALAPAAVIPLPVETGQETLEI